MIFRPLIIALFCSFLFQNGFTQNSIFSDSSQISIITIGPGSNLYDKFGHTAIRIQDSVSSKDFVYNYGVFDFNTPNFYLKFAQGKLNYKLGVSYFNDFLNAYKSQNRDVKEQILNLNINEKRRLFDFLSQNYKPENRYYLYDFFYDNCATKPRDVFQQILGSNLTYSPDALNWKTSFRTLIQQQLHWNTWGSLGINIALGAVVDKMATPYEHQFLPEYVFMALQHAQIQEGANARKLVLQTKTLNKATRTWQSNPSILWAPLSLFSVISLLIIGITIRDFKRHKRNRHVDGVIGIITGCIGCLLLFLWWGTNHTATAQNYNLLWAFPLNIWTGILLWKKTPPKWVKRYLFFLILASILLFLHWITGVQRFAYSLFPLFLALLIRYIFVWKKGFLK